MSDLGKEKQEKKKHALVVASMASMLANFNRNNISLLLELGFEVTLAANFRTEEDINSQEKIDEFVREMRKMGVYIVQIDFTRKIANVRQQVKAARQIARLLRRRFDLVHCHSPICAAVTRASFEKYRKQYGSKIIYTAHGFHFYEGAPLKNWILYYPAEAFLSRWTDAVVTINREDYQRAKRRFHAGKVIYIPGVGVDTEKFGEHGVKAKDRYRIRTELEIPMQAFVVISVGELNNNKNQVTIIRAIRELRDRNIYYIICGQGRNKAVYEKLIKQYGLEDYVKMVGYQSDVRPFLACADIFAFPSHREGLGMAALEAMAAGLPIVTSYVGGIKDYSFNGVTGYAIDDADDYRAFADAISKLKGNKQALYNMSKKNEELVHDFSVFKANRKMKGLYRKISG